MANLKSCVMTAFKDAEAFWWKELNIKNYRDAATNAEFKRKLTEEMDYRIGSYWKEIIGDPWRK